MAFTKHHAEWLSLIEISGPFLSIPVLERVFPQNLDKHDPDHYRDLHLAFDEWEDNQQGPKPSHAVHLAWVQFVLRETLGFPDEVIAEGQAVSSTLSLTMHKHGGETIRPDFLIKNPGGVANPGKVRMLVQVYPAGQDLREPILKKQWKEPPETRMVELLHATDIRLGLITNGERWMLVNAPRGETTGFTSWYTNIWFVEQITLRAFRSVLGVSRFFGGADTDTPEAMLIESASNQQEVTDQLGFQVRKAVEVLIQSLDRADQDYGGQLLADVSESVLYEAALTVMMRLVFLFSAEEQGLLLLGDELYDRNYAVSTLVAHLQKSSDDFGEERLALQRDAWVRLLTTFRVVFGGVRHDRMTLIPYSGKLFDPDRFPFLEGRKAGTSWLEVPATPLPINNRTVLHLLRSLQYLQMHGEARRLSFRALGVEQIGHVYEGLLDHTAKRADAPMLGLVGAKNEEPEVSLSELERESARGETYKVAYLREKTKRSKETLSKVLKCPVEGEDAKKLRAVCGNDEVLYKLVHPVSGLLRQDTLGWPVVIRKGSVFVTGGTDRRSSGTHYTPPELTKPIVQYALEPLVYIGPAEGQPENEWRLRPAKELLDLKICDMACGSGAFLVQACRYLSERLVEAWVVAEKENPNILGILPDGSKSTGASGEQPVPRDEHERLILARRFVAERCLYGVDKNPLAVEMAKLSLWLITLHKGQPFTFLDHAIRAGDSLLGITDIAQLENFHIDPKRGHDLHEGLLDIRPMVRSVIEKATQLRRKLESFTVKDDRDTHAKDDLLKEVEDSLLEVRVFADIVFGVALRTASQGDNAYDAEINRWARDVRSALDREHGVHGRALAIGKLSSKAQELLDVSLPDGHASRRPFHWALEFPEAFSEEGSGSGFAVVVGNPPFLGNKYWSGSVGDCIQPYAALELGTPIRRADLCALFFRRSLRLISPTGTAGLIGCESIREGDTRDISLVPISSEGIIFRAISSMQWPGDATVRIAVVWFAKRTLPPPYSLDGQIVEKIDAHLSANQVKQPFQLSTAPLAAKGTDNSRGEAFILCEGDEWLETLLRKHSSPFCRQYVTTEDLTSHGFHRCSRWIVDVQNLSLDEVKESCAATWSFLHEVVAPKRNKNPTSFDGMAERWWHLWRSRVELYQRIRTNSSCIVVPVVSKYLLAVRAPSSWVFTNKLCVLFEDSTSQMAVLSSSIAEAWVRTYSGSLGETLSVALEKALLTLPLPALPLQSPIERIAEIVTGLSRKNGIGYTDVYNDIHTREVTTPDVAELRERFVELDHAVAAAYDWADLDLGHDFHQTKQGIRFTISEAARRKALDRLLVLNHERYAEEVRQGLHDKKGKAAKTSVKRSRSTKVTEQPSLFAAGDDGEADAEDDRTEAGEAEGTPTEGPAPVQTTRPTSIESLDTNDVMAAFRQAARTSSVVERDALLKQVATALGYQRLGKKVEEALRNHLRAAIRRRIIEADGATMVRAGAATMADYDLEELRESFRSVMPKGRRCEREEVIQSLAHYLGFSRVTDSIRDPIKSAINSAIRQGVLSYEGSLIWREE